MVVDTKASREGLYADKTADYFSGARDDMVMLLTTNASSHILEIGCGDGATGAAALAAGKAGRYTGVELVEAVAGVARARLSEVVTGNIEHLNLDRFAGKCDAVLMSEVIEHLENPWECVARLVGCLRPGGQMIASSPNIAHHSLIRALIAGRFDYAEEGIMDRTHLRWFTPDSYRALFEAAGCIDIKLMPVRVPGLMPRLFNRLTSNRYAHLSMTQIMVHARAPG
jgi:2-polyprenyl-3-methyl-5-hydroxy-6-metoxy-1,4-benzoquinol methylase